MIYIFLAQNIISTKGDTIHDKLHLLKEISKKTGSNAPSKK